MSDRLKALGAGATIVDVSQIASPDGGGVGAGPTRERSPSEIVRSRREAGY